MPIFNASLTAIDISETRRYAGLNKADFPNQLLEDACFEAQMLVQAKGVWELYEYDSKTSTISGSSDYLLKGNKITAYLKEAKKVAVLAVTIGEALETAISEHFSKGNYAYAVLLDAAGTTAVEMAADQMNKAINQQASKLGFNTLSRFSPGYGDWNITEQPAVLTLAYGQTIGIQVTESCMLIPRKSVTAVIGFVPTQTIRDCTRNHCNNCSQQNCLARKEDI